MDIEYYIENQVDKLEIPLNFRQRNFLEKLFMDAYSKGNELAHAVMDKAMFASQAMPFLVEAIDPFKNDRNVMERLSLGEWADTVHVKNLLHNIRDRFFSRNASYTPKEQLLLHDLAGHENQIVQHSVALVEEGLLAALEDWCQNKLMNLATDELDKTESQPDRKTKVDRPLVQKD
jgi:hypothetical protein